MKLECEGVRERYEEDEVVYKCSTTECTCTFYANNQSLCRHILLIREQKCGLLSAIFELSLFHSRYHQQRNVELNSTAMHKLDETEDQVQLDEIEDRIRLDEVEVSVLSNRQKYNMMSPVTLSIASLSACHGTDQFQTYLKGIKEVERFIRSGSAIENCSLLAASTCASIQTKPNSTQIIESELPVPQPLNDENNSEGTSTTLEDKSMPADLTGRFQLKFKDKVKVRGRPKRALKQLCSFNKISVDRATQNQHSSELPSKKNEKKLNNFHV